MEEVLVDERFGGRVSEGGRLGMVKSFLVYVVVFRRGRERI